MCSTILCQADSFSICLFSFLIIEERIDRAESKDFCTYLGLSLAANNLPLFSRQSKTKLAGEASAKVEKKSKQTLTKFNWSISCHFIQLF
jgi:hypothetical protein